MSIAKPLSLSTNFFQLNLFIFQHFNDLFFGKQILLTNYIFSLNKNHFDLKLDIYYRQKKLIFYRKLKLKKKQEKKDLRAIYSIVKNLKLLLGTNCFSVHFRVLNKRVVYLAFFKPLKKKFKYFKKVLFQRRFGLLTDILKISILYFTHQILLQPLVNLIGELLQRLSKKKHGVFLRFVKILLNDGFLSLRKPKIYDKLYGCKFRISGKIRGKLRAKNISLIFGSIPISTFSKNIESGFTNVYTIYGVFGLKLWMCVGISPKKNFDKIIKRIFLFKEYLKKIKKIKNKKKLNHKKTIKKENSKKKTIKKKNSKSKRSKSKKKRVLFVKKKKLFIKKSKKKFQVFRCFLSHRKNFLLKNKKIFSAKNNTLLKGIKKVLKVFSSFNKLICKSKRLKKLKKRRVVRKRKKKFYSNLKKKTHKFRFMKSYVKPKAGIFPDLKKFKYPNTAKPYAKPKADILPDLKKLKYSNTAKPYAKPKADILPDLRKFKYLNTVKFYTKTKNYLSHLKTLVYKKKT